MSAVAAIILAAGTSSRYRAADPTLATKLVAEWGGVPLVRHAALAALASRAWPIIVVTGYAAAAVTAALDGLDLMLIHNPDFASGLATSLRAGLAALPPETSGALILLGDMPNVTPRELDRLIAAFGSEPDCDGVVPLQGGRRGNPALLGRTLFAAAQRLEGDEGARRLLAEARVREIAAEGSGVLIDVDDPATLHDLNSSSDTQSRNY